MVKLKVECMKLVNFTSFKVRMINIVIMKQLVIKHKIKVKLLIKPKELIKA